MTEKDLITKLAASVEQVPAHAEVIVLRQHSIEDLQQRARRVLTTVGEAVDATLDNGDWVSQGDHTFVQLPKGARLMIHHGSGAMRFTTGLAPMEALFSKPGTREALQALANEMLGRLRIREWIGEQEALSFEHLFQIKAAAAAKDQKSIEPVLCRIVGAYRHSVKGIPVWGAASVAVKLARDGALDALDVRLRQPTPEVLDRPRLLRPEQAAQHILSQLASLVHGSKVPFTELAFPQAMQLGYLDLGKRQPQRVLAPMYVATIAMRGKDESHGYILTTPATEKTYLPLGPAVANAPPAPFRRADHPSRLYGTAPKVERALV